MPTDEEYKELVSKLDSLTKKYEELKPKEDADSTPKEDARDVSIKRGTSFLKAFLEKDLPKDKLDTYTFNDLLVAAELKTSMKPASNLNPAPPLSKEDAVVDSRPEWQRPKVEASHT